MTKGNSEEPTATCTQRQGQALRGLARIREANISVILLTGFSSK